MKSTTQNYKVQCLRMHGSIPTYSHKFRATVLIKNLDNTITEIGPDYLNKMCLYRRKFNV